MTSVERDPFLTGKAATATPVNVEVDPFLTGGQKSNAIGKNGPSRYSPIHLQTIAVLVLVPWAVFVALLVAVAIPPPSWFWRDVAMVTWMASIGFVAVCYIVHKSGKGKIYFYLSGLTLAASILAPMFGQQIFVADMEQYWMHKSGVAYSQISPTKEADAVQDANIIDFSSVTRLDLRRVLGFRHQGTGTTYCVAPIMDSNSPSKVVNFWAAGMDCCEPLRSFICGEATTMSARSGIVIPSSTSSYAADRWHNFKRAASQAAEVYGFEIPERPIFVRWHVDALKLQADSLHHGLVEVVLLSFIYLMVSLFLAAWLHWSSSVQRYGQSAGVYKSQV